MKIATFNVNSIRARLPILIQWLKQEQPDIALLQETKVIDDDFPWHELHPLGYQGEAFGQKSYNGVAILTKHPLFDVKRGFDGDESGQARYLEASVNGIRIASVYVPNGNPVSTEKYDYKKTWLNQLISHVKTNLLPLEVPFILGGDFNICHKDIDVYDPSARQDDALCRPEIRDLFNTILNLGLIDTWRAQHPHQQNYSYWDYVKGRWPKDEGLRIDYLITSPQASDLLKKTSIDIAPRGQERPSDHTPVICEIEIPPKA